MNPCRSRGAGRVHRVSAGWMYRLIVELLSWIEKGRETNLRFAPVFPRLGVFLKSITGIKSHGTTIVVLRKKLVEQSMEMTV